MRDPYLAQEIDAAVAESDAVLAGCEASEARTKTKSGAGLDLIYKVTEQPPPQAEPFTELQMNAIAFVLVEERKRMRRFVAAAIKKLRADLTRDSGRPRKSTNVA